MTGFDAGLHGQRVSAIHTLISVVFLAVSVSGLTYGPDHSEEPLQYEVILPTRVDAKGHFLSNFLPHHFSRIQRREASAEPGNLDRIFYHLRHGGHSLHFNLTLNPNLLAPGFLVERRYGGLYGAQIHTPSSSQCHFLGEVWEGSTVRGRAAISTCDGLTGLFKLSSEEFFIRPAEQSSVESTAPQAHVVYKRHASISLSQAAENISGTQPVNGTCGVKDPHGALGNAEKQRERWESQRRRRRRRIRQRSVSKEKWVETLVVADPKMVEYHGSKGVETYVLSVMNIVSGLFRDASIGNAINIVVVRLILLEQDEADLKISHHADNSLNSFCKWQKGLNMKGDEHPLHHDVAVLLTRKDICAAINKPCETLGLSHVAGMCHPQHSCSISEDTGLPLAYTVTHELGHNFGIQHDGIGNDCEPIGKRPFVMSPQLLYGTTLPSWSRCSRQYITRFLDRGWGWCLDDAPEKNMLSVLSMPPGVLYSATHQCRLQYGSGSLLCDAVDNICSTLWCTVGTTCHSKMDGAVDGTSCGEDKWCFSGACVAAGHRPDRVHGGWASWSAWSSCSRTCGAGVQSAQRDCVNPIPSHGGKYCLGRRQRYRICNTIPCTQEQPTFRDIQCSHFNTLPYKGKLYKWVSVNNRVSPCELHCRPLNGNFSEKMLDAVTDGTRCYEGSTSRDMCINGICKDVGCDYVIDSNAIEDRCGVCHGNGSTCKTVKKTFEDSEGLGYVDIGRIPEGARDIRIEEVAEAGNFLALRGDNPDKYFLNGGWTIQWNGDYKAAGTVFTYDRTGNLENITSPGPTKEPLWIQLLFQETNPGVRYEYTISRGVHKDNDIPVLEFVWIYGAWTECSTTCGKGVRRQIVHCMEGSSIIVDENSCDPSNRPDDKHVSCNNEPCPAIWWVGEWQMCSSSCGSSGLAKRTVLCIQAEGVDDQRALQPSECKHIPKPESVTSCNTHIHCPSDWTTGIWSKCSVTCGGGIRRRNVTCSRNTVVDCDPLKRPTALTSCILQDCPRLVDIFGDGDWSGSGSYSKEVFNEINSIEADPLPKHSTTRAQPKDHNDLNNIIEADFLQNNYVEKMDKSSKANVEVDDFYYDYNFINFHEDLSYDSDTGNNGYDTKDNNSSGPPQEPKPDLSRKENIYTETTIKPTTTSNIFTARTLGGKKQDVSPDSLKVDSKLQTTAIAIEFISEDLFLPVSTSPPQMSSPARHSTTSLKNRQKTGFPGSLQLLPNRRETTKNNKQEAGNINGLEENNNEDDNVTLKSAVPTPVNQAIEVDTLTTHIGSHEIVDLDNEYSYHGKSTLSTSGPEISSSHRDLRSPEAPFSFPYTRVQTHTTTAVGDLHERSTEIPQATSDSLDSSNVLLPSLISLYKDLEQHDEDDGQDQSRSTELELILAVPPAQEATISYSVSSDFISGSQEDYHGTSSITGTDSLLTKEGGGTQSSPFVIQTSSQPLPFEPQVTTQFALIEENTPQEAMTRPKASTHDWSDYDYNEIVLSQKLRASPPRSMAKHLANTAATPQHSMATLATVNMPSQGSSFTLPIHQPSPKPTLLSTSVEATAFTQISTAAYWVVGNWSSCSTSCGLGAIWRALVCSTGSDSDCNPAKKPIPARRCYLRPCSTWKVGEWTKCSKNCGGGVTLREVQCHDMRDQRPLRPFHCQTISSRPRTHMSCNLQPCLDWYTSSWGQCSEVCGGGEQQRIVTCPEEDQCDKDLQPSNIQLCNSQPCVQWLTGSWSKCSATCGGGVQRRLIKCVNTKANSEEEVARDQCDPETWPGDAQKCNQHECEGTPSGVACLRDRLTSRFCQTLQWLGRCHIPTVRLQCCKTCSPRSRGDGRTAPRQHPAHHSQEVQG